MPIELSLDPDAKICTATWIEPTTLEDIDAHVRRWADRDLIDFSELFIATGLDLRDLRHGDLLAKAKLSAQIHTTATGPTKSAFVVDDVSRPFVEFWIASIRLAPEDHGVTVRLFSSEAEARAWLVMDRE